MGARAMSIVCNLLIVPLTVSYVNPTRYGVWVTLSSVIGWIAFFDIGLGNGFRNRFAEARAKGNDLLARQYLSTTYFAIGTIVMLVFGVICVLNQYVDWSAFLHIDSSYRDELKSVFAILSAFFCLNMVAGIFGIMLTADQKPGVSALINGLGQLMSLIAIFLLTRLTEGSLQNLATYYAGVPVIVMSAASVAAYSTYYKDFAPQWSSVRASLVKDVLTVGIQFFVIYICLILVFQMIMLVITRELGPEAATQYYIAKKYFNILYMVAAIIVTPFWSAFTDAYAKKDFAWMRSTVHRLEQLWLLCLAAGLLMLAASGWFYRVWIGSSVTVPFALSVSTLLFVESQTIGIIYMHMVNGIGTVRLQLVTYVLIALVSWLGMVCGGRLFGVCGVLVLPTMAYVVQAVLARIQLGKLLAGRAKGIWSR